MGIALALLLVLQDLPVERDLLPSELQTARELLNEWGRTRTKHQLNDFGTRAEPAVALRVPLFIAAGIIQTERRFQAYRRKPYAGENVPEAPVTAVDWSKIEVPPAKPYKARSLALPIPGSEKVRACSACSNGTVDCPTCRRSGMAECPSCSNGRIRCHSCGGGGKNPCSSCSGSGRRESGYGKNKRLSSCSSCGGSGKRNCSTCYGTGKTDCSYCSDGYNPCRTCNRTGTVKCETCRGVGKLLYTLVARVETELRYPRVYRPERPEFERFKHFNTLPLFQFDFRSVPEAVVMSPLYDLVDSISNGIDWSKTLNAYCYIFCYSVWWLQVRYDGATYQIVIDPSKRDVHTEADPSVHVARRLAEEAQRAYREGRYDDATTAAHRALDFDPHSPVAHVVARRTTDAKSKQQLTGGALGAAVAFFMFILLRGHGQGSMHLSAVLGLACACAVFGLVVGLMLSLANLAGLSRYAVPFVLAFAAAAVLLWLCRRRLARYVS